MSKGYNISVRPRRNEHQYKMIRRFNKKVKKSGLLEDVKNRRHYTKPSDQKREEKKRAIRAQKRELEKAKAKRAKHNRSTNYKSKRS